MSNLVEFIRDFQQLGLPAGGAAAELFERTMQALLDAEGPPAEPIAGISTPSSSAIARSPKGRPLFLCHTWETGPWTCLLLDLAPVVMGRPVFLPNPAGRGLPRVVTDYQSQKFQRRIASACIALNLPRPPEPSRLCSLLDLNRLFLAWSPFTGSAPALKGDLDNYAKNVMDALQRARIVTNDRTIASVSFTRAILPPATQSLDARLLADLLAVQAEHPKLNQRSLAKKAGLSQRHTQRLLKLAQQQAANEPILEDLTTPGPQTPPPAPAGVVPAAPAVTSTLPASVRPITDRRRRPRRPDPRRRRPVTLATPAPDASTSMPAAEQTST